MPAAVLRAPRASRSAPVTTPPLPAPTIHAGGAVVWRVDRGHLQVLLVHRPRYDDWSWPKGKVEPGESLPVCAVREVGEETGLPVVLGQPLPGVRYRLSDGRLKQCHYWAARVLDSGSPALAARGVVPRCSPEEIDDARWVTVPEARRVLTRAADRLPLDALVDLWDDGHLDTRALVVLRHGRAKKRSAWKGGEDDRPLTAVGLHQAVAAVGMLAAYGVSEVYTSPWERCAASVRPYALASGLTSVAVPELTEAAAKRRPGAARSAVTRLVGEFRHRRGVDVPEGAVLCTHRPVLPLVIEALASRASSRVRATLPRENPYLRTGELLVVHVLPRHRRGVRIVSAERSRPPV